MWRTLFGRSIHNLKKMSSASSSKSSPYFPLTPKKGKSKDDNLSLKGKLEKNEESGTTERKRAKKLSSKTETKPPQGPTSVAIKKKDLNIPAGESTDTKQVKWEPKHWKEVLENLRSMRSSRSAPVDTMGCHMCSDEKATPAEKRFHILVALMLSSQTKDEVGLLSFCLFLSFEFLVFQVTFEAMKRLRDHGLTPGKIAKTDPAKLEDVLKPVSFYKVSYLIA